MKVLILSLLLSLSAFAETRTPIAVLDTGIKRTMAKKPYMCKDGLHHTVGYSSFDFHGHGSNIIGIIAKDLDIKKYCILSIKVFHFYHRKGHSFTKYDIVNGLKLAIKKKARFINMSIYGPESDPAEKRYMRKAVTKGATILIAAGNQSRNLDVNCDAYPACYRLAGTHIVGSGFSDSNRNDKSNYGKNTITDWRDGDNVYAGGSTLSGTSQAAAILTGELTKKKFTNTRTQLIIDEGDNDDFIPKYSCDLFRCRRYDYSLVQKCPSRRNYSNTKRKRNFSDRQVSSSSKARRKFKTTQNKRSFNRSMERRWRELGEACSCGLRTRRVCRHHNE